MSSNYSNVSNKGQEPLHFTSPTETNEALSSSLLNISNKLSQFLIEVRNNPQRHEMNRSTASSRCDAKSKRAIESSEVEMAEVVDSTNKLRDLYHSVLQNLNQSVTFGKNCFHLPEALYFRALMIREYINEVLIPTSQSTESLWQQFCKDCTLALQDSLLPERIDLQPSDNGHNSEHAQTAHIGVCKLDFIRLRGEAFYKLNEFENAKDDLLICVTATHQFQLEMEALGHGSISEDFIDLEAVDLLQKVVSILNEKKEMELQELQENFEKTSRELKRYLSGEDENISTAVHKESKKATLEETLNEKDSEIHSEMSHRSERSFDVDTTITSWNTDSKEKSIQPSIENSFHSSKDPSMYQDVHHKNMVIISRPVDIDKKISSRQQCGSTFMNDIMFFFGGYNNDEEELNDFVAFDLRSKRWKVFDKFTEKPSPRYGHILAHSARNNSPNSPSSMTFYLYGGRTEDGPSGELWKFHMKHGWSLLSKHEALFGHSSFMFDDELYIVFGRMEGTTYNDSVHKYSVSKNEWTILPNFNKCPSPRVFSSGVQWKDNQFVIHGGLGLETKLNDIWVYCTTSNKWKELPSHGQKLPYLYNHSLSIHNDYLLICGGYEEPQLYIFSLTTYCWRVFSLQSPENVSLFMREGYTSIHHKDTLYIFFGQDEENHYCRTIEAISTTFIDSIK